MFYIRQVRQKSLHKINSKMIKFSPPPFKEFLTTIVKDFTEFTFAKFISERYYLHFFICAVISMFSDYPLLMGVFVTGIAVFREVYFHWKGAPFSWPDIRWTYYGCVLAFIIKLFI